MARLSSICPFLIVADLRKSVAYYVDKLGFEVQYITPGGNPFFAIVGRDDISIMLKGDTVDVSPVPNHLHQPWARWDAFISATDVDRLYEEFVSAGVVFQQPLRDDDDGLRGFEVVDADGYILFFGRPK